MSVTTEDRRGYVPVLYIHILFYNVYVNNYYMITSSFCWFVQVLRVQAVKRRVTRGRAITNYKSAKRLTLKSARDGTRRWGREEARCKSSCIRAGSQPSSASGTASATIVHRMPTIVGDARALAVRAPLHRPTHRTSRELDNGARDAQHSGCDGEKEANRRAQFHAVQ